MLLCRDEDGPHYVKFGHSCRPGERISELMVGCPVPGKTFSFMLVDSDPKALELEKRLHLKFAHRRTKGEWFRFNLDKPEDVAELDGGVRSLVLGLKVHNPVWTRVDLKKWSEADKQRKAIAARQRAEHQRKMRTRARIMAIENAARREAKYLKFCDDLEKTVAAEEAQKKKAA